jgi:hypothetical protein
MSHQQISINKGLYWFVALIALVPAIVKVLCYPHYIGSDDAYIHLRIATNFVQGLGWGINPHEPVNLSTAPAFTMILAAAEIVTSHAVALTQILSAGAAIAGLIFIFLAALSDTASVNAALFAEIAAAFSMNLWRWNGALMEATFAFAAVAITFYLFRRNAPNGPLKIIVSSVVLGVGLLLRPEMGLLVVLALFVQWMRSERSVRVRNAAFTVFGVLVVVTPWCVFSLYHLGSIVPTTFAAKSTTHLIFFNPHILRQFAESVLESILFPTLLILLLLVVRRRDFAADKRVDVLAFVLPVGWIVGLVGFYYLNVEDLQSAGRYLLPLLPAEVMVLALVWAKVEEHLTVWQQRLAWSLVGLHMVFAVTVNYKFVTPVLVRFESEYGNTMRAVAEELAKQTEGRPNRRVLVETDIGVVSYAGNGRFEIYDGGALATPSLRGLDVRDQILQVHPAYIVESLGETADGIGAEYPDLLSRIWERRYLQHGVRKSEPYFYAIIYQSKESMMSALK